LVRSIGRSLACCPADVTLHRPRCLPPRLAQIMHDAACSCTVPQLSGSRLLEASTCYTGVGVSGRHRSRRSTRCAGRHSADRPAAPHAAIPNTQDNQPAVPRDERRARAVHPDHGWRVPPAGYGPVWGNPSAPAWHRTGSAIGPALSDIMHPGRRDLAPCGSALHTALVSSLGARLSFAHGWAGLDHHQRR
jgi:hypothetical protein